MGLGYVSAKLVLNGSVPFLRELEDRFNLKLMPYDEMHVTLVYDERNVIEKSNHRKNSEYVARVVGVERMGDRGSKWEALALTLASKDLERRHKELKAKEGFKHSYPEYKAHMSLLYRPTKENVDSIPEIEEFIKRNNVILSFTEVPWVSTED